MKRGYVGIGIETGKTEANHAILMRSALCFDADFVFTIGERYKRHKTDPINATAHMPCFNFKDVEDFYNHLPLDCKIVGVELLTESEQLETFKHPQRAIYLLGKEDGSLSLEAQDICDYLVKFKSKFCINVAEAGTVVLYDRQLKQSNNS